MWFQWRLPCLVVQLKAKNSYMIKAPNSFALLGVGHLEVTLEVLFLGLGQGGARVRIPEKGTSLYTGTNECTNKVLYNKILILF